MSGEVRRMMDTGGGNMMQPAPPEADTYYPDSVGSSPRSSRDADSDFNRWEAGDAGGSSRVRLMCSFGGKIAPRPHDNQLTYVGGETRILAVERNIRYAGIMARLAALIGAPGGGQAITFKYQLPNEDLDALVSVTNDEDLDNMMAEYDRLCKLGYRFSRLRLFIFRSAASENAPLEEPNKRDNWFVDALNAAPQTQTVTRSESGAAGSSLAGSETSVWSNNIPDYLFGLENKPVDDGDRNPAYDKDEGSARNVTSRVSTEKTEYSPAVSDASRPSPQMPQQQQPVTVQQQAVPVQEFQRLGIRQNPAPQPVTEAPRKPFQPDQSPATGDVASEVQPQFVSPAQPVSYWQMPDGSHQVYVVHGGAHPVVQRPQAHPGYYVQPQRQPVNQPPLIYGAESVAAVRPTPVVQRQQPATMNASAEISEPYREQAPAAKVAPQPVYAAAPSAAPAAAAQVMYRPVHVEPTAYGYHHVYDATTGAARPVYYAQQPSAPVPGVVATSVPYAVSSGAVAPPADMAPRVTQSSS